MSKCKFQGGSWEFLSQQSELKERFDVILMSETLYNPDYYESLVKFIDHCLMKDGIVIIGTKTYYFGLGGGYYEFRTYLAEKWKCKFQLEVA